MAPGAKNPQARQFTVGLAVTEEERRAIAFVAAARGLTGDSPILRELSVRDVLREYRKLIALHEQQQGEAA